MSPKYKARKKRVKNKKLNAKKEKKSHSNKIILCLIILTIVLFKMYKITIIGNDHRYFNYALLSPILLGMICLAMIKLQSIRKKLAELDKIFHKMVMMALLFLKGFFVSVASFGILAHVIWVNLNKNKIAESPPEMIECKVERLSQGTSRSAPSVRFFFQDGIESIPIDNKTYGKFYDTDPATLKLSLIIREGIWNKYIVDDWTIEQK